MIKVRGIGGVFFKCENPEELKQWYNKYLGFNLDEYGCTTFNPTELPEKAYGVWSPFKADTDYLKPSNRGFMINLIVDDVKQVLEQVKQGGAEVIDDVVDEEYGVFGWFIDPAGVKIELWTPK